MKSEDVLHEAVRLIGSVPDRATFVQDLDVNHEWLGAVLYLFKASGDQDLYDDAQLIVSDTDNRTAKKANQRSRLLIYLQQIKREHEVKLGYSIPRNYRPLSDEEVNQLQESAEALKETIQKDNELSEEDRDLALYEIAVFEASLNSARLSPDLIARFVNGFLRGAVIQLSSALIKEAASRLADQLLNLMGWSV